MINFVDYSNMDETFYPEWTFMYVCLTEIFLIGKNIVRVRDLAFLLKIPLLSQMRI